MRSVRDRSKVDEHFVIVLEPIELLVLDVAAVDGLLALELGPALRHLQRVHHIRARISFRVCFSLDVLIVVPHLELIVDVPSTLLNVLFGLLFTVLKVERHRQVSMFYNIYLILFR